MSKVKLENILREFCGKGHKWVNVRINRPVEVLKTSTRQFRKITEGVFGLCCDYENTVNAHREREGKDTDFKAQAPKGKIWDVYPYTLKKEKDDSVHYLRLYKNHNTASTVIYVDAVTGARVPASEVKPYALSSEFREPAKNENQGVENIVIPFDVKEENLDNVWVGDEK